MTTITSTTVYLDQCLLSISTKVYLLLGRLLGPLALLLGKTSIFFAMMCCSSVSQCIVLGFWLEQYPLTAAQWTSYGKCSVMDATFCC